MLAADNVQVVKGDRVVCFYATPIQWGTIVSDPDDAGWFDVAHDDWTRGYYNGERVAAEAPSSGPAAIGPDPQEIQ